MIRKIFLFSTVFLFIINIATAMDEENINACFGQKFNPEDVNFSTMDTIDTWLVNKYHKDRELKQGVQDIVFGLVPESWNVKYTTQAIVNDPGENRYFGKVFSTIRGIELPFLQYIKTVSQYKELVTLEIAAANGVVSWKVPLAFEKGGTHYANELSSRMMTEKFIPLVSGFFSHIGKPDLIKSIKTIPGSCFDILQKHPELEGKVDVIYVQNLEHFFNPKDHRRFFGLIEKLLAPGGRAYLCAQAPIVYFYGGGSDIESYHKKLLELESKQFSEEFAKNPYHSFLECDIDFIQLKGMQAQHEVRISNARRIKEDDIECSVYQEYAMDKGRYYEIRQHVITNGFSPRIYREAISLQPGLEVLDAYFLNWGGVRYDQIRLDSKCPLMYACAIVQKKSAKEEDEDDL